MRARWAALNGASTTAGSRLRSRRSSPTRWSLQLDALAGEDLGLAVKRQGVVVLAYDDGGEEPRTGAAAGHHVIGCPCGDDGVASPARQLLADMSDHLEGWVRARVSR